MLVGMKMSQPVTSLVYTVEPGHQGVSVHAERDAFSVSVVFVFVVVVVFKIRNFGACLVDVFLERTNQAVLSQLPRRKLSVE
jgi:hypothetical protein